jgi:hypothetical protein
MKDLYAAVLAMLVLYIRSVADLCWLACCWATGNLLLLLVVHCYLLITLACAVRAVAAAEQ